MPQRRSIRKSSSKKALSLLHWLHAPFQDGGAFPSSSGVDFLPEVHLRRDWTDQKARKTNMPERRSTRESSSKELLSLLQCLHAPGGALSSSELDFLRRTDKKAQKVTRKERTTMIIEQAFDIIDADW
jgi:hypothetical protein